MRMCDVYKSMFFKMEIDLEIVTPDSNKSQTQKH